MALTSEQFESFESEGFLTGIDVSGQEQVRSTREAFDEFEARVGREKCQEGIGNLHFQEAFAWDLTTNPQVLDNIESLLGPEILLLGTRTFCKYGPSDDFVAWHQDVTYWGLEPPFAVNAWIAIDDSDADNGCVQFVPRSHKWGLREHGKADEVGNLLSLNQQVPMSEEESSQVVDNELKAGQISIHHGMMAHGSRPNRSTRRRCGMAMIYVPASSRPAEIAKGQWKVVPVRGEVNEGHFEQVPSPLL